MPRYTMVSLAVAAAALLSACTYEPGPGYYGEGPPPGAIPPGAYGPTPGMMAAYDDPCATDPGYCSYPYYYGPVWFDGAWYNGPHRCRTDEYGREFWVGGGWHGDVRIGVGGYWRASGRWTPY